MVDQRPDSTSILRQTLSALQLKRLQWLASQLRLSRSGRKQELLDRLAAADRRQLLELLTPEERGGIDEDSQPSDYAFPGSGAGHVREALAAEGSRKSQDPGPFEPLPWTLTVEGFGRIRRAEVRPHPLTLLIGPNNSGKSYLASLLWGMVTPGVEFFPFRPDVDSRRQVEDWWKGIFEGHDLPVSYHLSMADYALLTRWLNDQIQHTKDRVVQTLLNASALQAPRIALTLAPRARCVYAERPRSFPRGAIIASQFNASEFKVQLGAHTGTSAIISPLDMFPQWLMTGKSLRWSFDLLKQPPPFLPASRTGFMLTYKAVVQHQLRKLNPIASREAPSIDLPLPAVSFLELLATGTDGTPGPFADEAAFLERAALGGLLEVRRGQLNEFFYHPTDGTGPQDMSLAMHLSSSLVTELSPLIYVLRYSKELQHLFIEEPEAHLHPHLQRVMAQLVTRLVRRGVFVWITTHSENFCQQINNFIKLGTLPHRSRLQVELGYASQDYLYPQEVGAYQFADVAGQSEVTALERTDEGIAMPGFNEELYDLARQTRRLRDAREEG